MAGQTHSIGLSHGSKSGPGDVRSVPAVWQRRMLAFAWGTFIACAMGFAYYLAARFGLMLQSAPGSAAVIWPASGIAAGALVALGRSARIPVALGVATATVAAHVMTGMSLQLASVFALCNAGECLLFAALIEHVFGPGFNLDRITGVVGFVASSVTAAAPFALAAALATHADVSPNSVLFHTAITWFLTNIMGLLTLRRCLFRRRRSCGRNAPSVKRRKGSCNSLS